MKTIKVDDAVQFTNSAGRTILGHVTVLDHAWVTVFEQPGSVYRLPRSAVKHAKAIA
jgi:hypothetical protein